MVNVYGVAIRGVGGFSMPSLGRLSATSLSWTLRICTRWVELYLFKNFMYKEFVGVVSMGRGEYL